MISAPTEPQNAPRKRLTAKAVQEARPGPRAYKLFDGVVPEPSELDAEDRALLEKVEAGFETVGELYSACKFRAALGEALAWAREANGYLDR